MKDLSRKEDTIIKAFSILLLITFIAWLIYSWDTLTNHELIVSAAIGYVSVVLGIFTFFWKRNVDKFQFGNKKREEFILNEYFIDIRSRIEHDDPVLQTTIAILNLPHPQMYKPDLLPADIRENAIDLKKLHEYFDDYLNWIEGFAILWKKGLIADEELEGLWSYYPKRLREVKVSEEKVKECLQTWTRDIQFDCFFSTRRAQNVKDPISGDVIDPIEKPIWFYINVDRYAFTAIKDLIREIMRKEPST